MVVCSHYIVPELGPETKFQYASKKAVSEYKEAKEVRMTCVSFCCMRKY